MAGYIGYWPWVISRNWRVHCTGVFLDWVRTWEAQLWVLPHSALLLLASLPRLASPVEQRYCPGIVEVLKFTGVTRHSTVFTWAFFFRILLPFPQNINLSKLPFTHWRETSITTYTSRWHHIGDSLRRLCSGYRRCRACLYVGSLSLSLFPLSYVCVREKGRALYWWQPVVET